MHGLRSFPFVARSLKLRVLFVCTFLVLLLTSIGFSSAALAYTLQGPTWQFQAATYKIDSSFSNQSTGWTGRADTAAQNWTDVSISPFAFGKNTNSPNVIKAGSTGNCKLAVTTWNWSGSFYTSTPVTVNTSCGTAFYDGTQAPTIPSNYYDLASVMRHELGHVQGLCHSGTSGLLMYPTLNPGTTYGVGVDAQNGSAKLYNTTYTGPGPEGGCIP